MESVGEYISPSDTMGSALTDENVADNKASKNGFESYLRQLVAQQHKFDHEIERVKIAVSVCEFILRAPIRELEANSNPNTAAGTYEKLVSCKKTMTIAQETMREDAGKLETLVTELRAFMTKLCDERDHLHQKFTGAEAWCRRENAHAHSVNQSNLSTIARLEGEIQDLTSMNIQTQRKLSQLRSETSGTQTKRLGEGHGTHLVDRAQTFQHENARLREHMSELENDTAVIKKEFAQLITGLDTTNAGFGIIENCQDDHEQHKSATVFEPAGMAHVLFNTLRKDDEFISYYRNCRRAYVKYHLLHDQVGGEDSSRLQKEFARVDGTRCINISYE